MTALVLLLTIYLCACIYLPPTNNDHMLTNKTSIFITGKKNGKKTLKRKSKTDKVSKDKAADAKTKSIIEDVDGTPVRQSRRIAQMKIKEEADRRHLEEVALRELKMIHKKKVCILSTYIQYFELSFWW